MGNPLLLVVGVRHIHAVMYPFFVLPAVKLAPLVLGPGSRARSGLTKIPKFVCSQNGIVSSICGRSLGCTTSGVSGTLLVLGTFLLQGRGQSDHNLVVVGALIVPLAGRLVFCVHVYHISNDGADVEG